MEGEERRGEERRGEVLAYLRSTIHILRESKDRVAGKAAVIYKAQKMIDFIETYKTPEKTMSLFKKEIQGEMDVIDRILQRRNGTAAAVKAMATTGTTP